MSWQARAAAEEIGIKHNLSPVERLVLDRMAGTASKDGTGIYPSMDTLKYQTGASISTIYRAIRHFIQLNILEYGDPKLVAHIPADNRPRVYNMVLSVTARLKKTFAKFARMPRKRPVDKPVRPVTVTPGTDKRTGHSDRQTVNSLKENPPQPPADAVPASPEVLAHGAALRAALQARREQKAQGLPVTVPLPYPTAAPGSGTSSSVTASSGGVQSRSGTILFL